MSFCFLYVELKLNCSYEKVWQLKLCYVVIIVCFPFLEWEFYIFISHVYAFVMFIMFLIEFLIRGCPIFSVSRGRWMITWWIICETHELSCCSPVANTTDLQPYGYSRHHKPAHVAADHEAVLQSPNSQ
jgi:hypothetical protein